MRYKTIELVDNEILRFLDQRILPVEIQFFDAKTYEEVVYALADMIVRGAPAIGATGAYGVYIAANQFKNLPKEEFLANLRVANKAVAEARPTAVNLSWGVKRMEKILEAHLDDSVEEIVAALRVEADTVAREDIEINKTMAKHGNTIVPEGATILTHCNTGALATVDWGTALGVVREAHFTGKNIKVYADETRPRLQGARLTAFELVEEQIPSTLIPDGVAATLIRDGKIDLVLVGADRIAANGDTANKIGTYAVSEICRRFNVPFYIVAPTSTIDFEITSGKEIEIEERDAEEVTHISGVQVAPTSINVFNPAFDVTPAENITGIITEKGILRAPFTESIAALRK